MDQATWSRVQAVFQGALEVSPAERETYLRRSCADDPTIRAEVQRLLAGHADPGFLDTASHAPRAPRTPEEAAGDRVGVYVLRSILGRGGFGTVWLASRQDPIDQEVALKILDVDSSAVAARFQQERQSLARMDHPNIAKLHDAGQAPSGRPYFAMEYVQGEVITRFCDARRLTLRQRMELFVPVCEAVQHAHSKGIIHRDLKPGNVMVSEAAGPRTPAGPGERPTGATGVVHGALVKVIDFGIAKAVSPLAGAPDAMTQAGQLIGTPEYMSPEQAAMDPSAVDTSTDVYSLGVLLYELLAGALPFSRGGEAGSIGELLGRIRDEPAPRPSTLIGRDPAAFSAAAENRGLRPSALARALAAELEWIPLRALKKDPRERYRTPAELAEDVSRFVNGLALRVGPDSAWYRTRKFVARNRAAVAIAGTAITLGIAGTAWQFSRAVDARDRALGSGERADALRILAEGSQARSERAQVKAERALARKQAVMDGLSAVIKSVMPDAAQGRRDLTVREVLDGMVRRLDTSGNSGDPSTDAELSLMIGRTYFSLGEFARAEPQFRRALDWAQRAGEEGGMQAAEAMRQLADLLVATRSNLPEAAELIERSIEAYRGLGATATQEYAKALTVRVFVLAERGLLTQAQAAAQDAVEAYKAAGSADADGNLAQAQLHLGAVMVRAGRVNDGAKLVREARGRMVELFGPRHTGVFNCDSVLWLVEFKKGRHEEAVRILRENLAVRKEIQGQAHPNYRLDLSRLAAGPLLSLKRFDEADAAAVEAVRLYAAAGEIHDPNVGDLLSNVLRETRGKQDSAQRAQEAWLPIQEIVIPEAEREIVGAIEAEKKCAVALHAAVVYDLWWQAGGGEEAKSRRNEWIARRAALGCK